MLHLAELKAYAARRDLSNLLSFFKVVTLQGLETHIEDYIKTRFVDGTMLFHRKLDANKVLQYLRPATVAKYEPTTRSVVIRLENGNECEAELQRIQFEPTDA